MKHAECLRDLLRPLGVYNLEATFNGGELDAQGECLDRAMDWIEEVQRAMGKREGAGSFGRYIFYGDIYERLTGGRVASNPSMDAFGCYRNVPCHQACFYDKRLLTDRGFDIGYRVRADYEHFLWSFYRAQALTVYLPVTVALYEGDGFSETKENVRISKREHKQIVGKYMPPAKVLQYRLLMLLTLAPVRTYLSRSPVTARLYQTGKGKVYEVYRRVSGKKR